MTSPRTSKTINWNFWLGAGVVLVLFMAFSLPTLIILTVGLLPTGVAFVIDRSDQKSGTFCVGGMNMSGVIPFIIKLWADNHTLVVAIEIVSDIFSLLIMYAAAGFGWMMFLTVPPVIASFLSVISQTRVKFLKASQRKILDEWGPEIATNSETNIEEDRIGAEHIGDNAEPVAEKGTG